MRRNVKVKVWFQNRRTKHKRQKQEEEQQSRPSDGQSSGKDESNGDHPSSVSPTIEESDESMCEDEDECDESTYDNGQIHNT
ncbi:hypothetical protein TNCV_1375301 [Trichonephila clavipes]|nr:hypothetical protein TNCV_1375301 [Trichonephila clavipes]